MADAAIDNSDVFRDVASEMIARYPALANPAPLAPTSFDKGHLNPVYDQETFRQYARTVFEDIGAEIEAGTYRLRMPAATTEGLIGPIPNRGNCLHPLIPEGKEVLRWIDPTIAPDHGDLVTVIADEELLAPYYRQGFEENAEFAAMYPRPLNNTLCKLLVHLNLLPLLIFKGGGFNIAGNKIIGVTRYMTVDGVPVYGSGERHD